MEPSSEGSVRVERPVRRIGFSLKPDPWMAWIYDHTHPEYMGRGKDLRERRDAALRSCPQWMLQQAAMNDDLDRA